MIKLTACIVTPQFSIAGFIARGKNKEFGGMTDEEVTVALEVKKMAMNKFKNNQINVLPNSQIVEKGNFKLNELPMQLLENGELKQIDNKITLVTAIHKDGECLGYDVVISGLNKRLTTKSISQLSRYFKPTNFMSRVNANNTEFLSGMNGTKLGELPVIELGAPVSVGKSSVTTEKKMEQKRKANEHGVVLGEVKEEKMAPNCSLIDLYSFLQTVCGYIAIFSGEGHAYEKTTENREQVSNEFTSINLAELARIDHSSYTFNKTELNVSATFKKPGLVRLPSGQVVSTYVVTNKKLINNGKNHMKRIGIAVPKVASDNLKNFIADPYRLKELKNEQLEKSLETLYNVHNLDLFDLDIEDMPVVLEDNLKNYIMNSEQLNSLVRKQVTYNLACKLLRPATGLIGELKKEIGSREASTALGYKVNPMFNCYKDETLLEIQASGIDIFSGMFNRKQANESYGSSGSGDSVEKVIPIEIDYYLKGFELKNWTYKEILADVTSNEPKLSAVLNLLGSVLKIEDPREKLVAVSEIYEKLNTVSEVLGKTLWLHKYSMYKKYNGVHANDALDWTPVATKKKNALVYENEKYNGLIMELKAINMITQ